MKGAIYPYYKRDRSGVRYQDGWQVRFGRDITKYFKDIAAAERFLNGVRYETDRGTFDSRDYAKGNPLSFEKLANQWLDFKQQRIKPTSFAPLRNYMGQAIDAWGNANVKTIDYAAIEDFLFQRDDISEKTRHNMRACLGQFFKWVERRYKIPAPELPPVSFELGWRNIVDLETQQQVVEKVREISGHINPRIYVGIHLLRTYPSIRPGELMALTERQFNVKLGAIVIPHPKEKKPKVIYLDAEDLALLRALPRGLPDMPLFRHPDGTRFGQHYLWKWWRRACAELGVEGVDLYGGTKHSTITALGEVCSPEEVRGYSRVMSKALERYLQGEKQRAVATTGKLKALRGDQQHINNVSNLEDFRK